MVPDSSVVSPVAFLIVSWFAQRDFHIGYVVSPVAFLIATWSCNRYRKVALGVALPVQTHCQGLHEIVGSDHGPGAPQERLFAGASSGALQRPGEFTGAWQGHDWLRCNVRERKTPSNRTSDREGLERRLGPEPCDSCIDPWLNNFFQVFAGVAGARDSRSSSCRVQQRCRSAWRPRQQLLRPGALRERCGYTEAAAGKAAVAGAAA